nr:reverse transcriptase domain-containing protein [Tanacetum cinerariifolium]
MLEEHNITYRLRTSMKGHILADFLVKKTNEAPPDTSVVETLQYPWTLFTDGSSCVDGSEYEALIVGLRVAAQMGVHNVHVSIDSKLVANHVLRTYVAKEENMIKYLEKAKSLAVVSKAVAKVCWTTPSRLCDSRNSCGVMQYARRTMVRDGQSHASNELVERASRSLCEGIKAHLGEGKKNRIEEIPHVLWAYRMMINSSHGDTSFSLTYETEAVILAEIKMPTYRTAVVDAMHNDEELRLNLDLLEERRKRAIIREARAKLKMTKYYNARV